MKFYEDYGWHMRRFKLRENACCSHKVTFFKSINGSRLRDETEVPGDLLEIDREIYGLVVNRQMLISCHGRCIPPTNITVMAQGDNPPAPQLNNQMTQIIKSLSINTLSTAHTPDVCVLTERDFVQVAIHTAIA